jgi:histidinol dehydrogenase
MKLIKYPQQSDWSSILARPAFDNSQLLETVKAVLNDVRSRGDEL